MHRPVFVMTGNKSLDDLTPLLQRDRSSHGFEVVHMQYSQDPLAGNSQYKEGGKTPTHIYFLNR